MENSFAMACTEVLEILKCLPQDEYEKIPEYEIELLESQKDQSYKFNIDKSLQLQEINISKRANAIIVILWEKYFASQNEKEKLYSILQQNYQREEERKKEQYDYNNIFKEKKKENTSLIPVREENWYEKVYKFCKKIMNKLKRS